MTKEQVLLMVAGALIVLGMFVIVTALRRARQRDHARDRVDALLDLCAEPETPEPVAVPVMSPVHAAPGHRYVVTVSDTSGSFGVRPGFNQGQTTV